MNIQHQISVSDKLRELLVKVGPIRCIYECGSRDALDGLELLKITNAAELHAFECNPQAVVIARDNIAKSPMAARARVVELALAEKVGTLLFHSIDPDKTATPHADGNIGASSLYLANPDYPKERYVQRAIEVSAISLDDYSQNNSPPDFLWMDLQGAEARVLDGAQSILPKVKIIHVEVSFRSMYLKQALFDDVHARLKKRFNLVDLDLGRWPRLPRLYSALNIGPWVGNAIYVNRNWSSL